MKIRCMNCMKEYEDGLERCPLCGFIRGTPPKEIYHLHPEVVLADRYVIGTVAAYGGFGILYRAWDQKLQVMVAVKEYFPSNYVNRNPGEKDIFIYTSKKQGEFQEGLESFLDEARNTAKFSSYPNIVNVYDYFKENKTAYMVMEYMDGITLKQYTKEQGGKIGWQRAVEIITSICDDLQVVHEAGILHRDISPDNIMLCSDGTVKLFDFGAARFSSAEHEMTRTVVLKIGFAPPEQYRAKSRQGAWTDIYALGATLYRTITGILPDESVNRQEAVLEDGRDTLVRPRELAGDIPEYLDIAICRAMAIEPALRFRNVLQFKDALLNKKQYMELEKELQSRKRKRKLGISMLLTLMIAAAVVCFTYYRDRQNEIMLRGADVSIWVPVAQGENADEVESILDHMLEEFRADYPEVQVSISCYPEEDYQQKLLSAADSKDGFPTLYEEGEIGSELDGRGEELSDLLELVNTEDYNYLEQARDKDGMLRRLPLGMHMAVVYGNISLMEDNSKPSLTNDRDAFLEGGSAIWIGDSRDYGEVQERLPGIYTVIPLRQERVIAGFDELWAVDSQAGKIDKLAAKRILYYFLGETAQDVLHLQNDTNLPLNKNEFATYLDVNQELGFLRDQVEAGMPAEFFERDAYQKQLDTCYSRLIADEQAMAKLKEWQNGGDQ